MDLKSWIRDIPDFPKPGIMFRDITPLLASPEGFANAINLLRERSSGLGADLIAGVESRGFLFGTPLAQSLDVGFVPIRKPGKLPCETVKAEYALEYGTDTVEMHRDAVGPGQKVIIVDDLLATGGTMEAACRLVEQLGAQVVGCFFVVELAALGGRDKLPGKKVESLIIY